MNIDLIILVLASIANVLLGMIVLLRNAKSPVNLSIFFLSLAVTAWTACNYLADFSTLLSLNELFTRLTFVSGMLIANCLLAFSLVFPKNKFDRSITFKFILSLIALSVFSFSSLVTQSVSKGSVAGIQIETGLFYWLYVIIFIGFIFFTFKNFIKSFKDATTLQRSQMKFIALGLIAGVTIGVFSNLLLPIILNSWSSSRFGPLAGLFFVGGASYAIIRHHFLDIRLVVTRSITYILLLGSVSIMYGLFLFASSSFFFKDQELTFSQQLFYLVVALVLALTFQPLKRFFDKVTRSIFYRDSYDTKRVLDSISTKLVSAVSVTTVLDSTINALRGAIKPNFITVYLSPTKSQKTFGSKARIPDAVVAISENDPSMRMLVIESYESDSKPIQMFRSSGVAVTVKLMTSKEEVGQIFFGYKQNGSMFTQQDLDLIKIVADELAIALQNSLRFEEISQFNVKLKQEVEDATAQLRETNKKLRKLDEIKDEFISMASHQLRTPLTSVKGYISMVLEGDVGKVSSQQRELLEQAFSSTQRMVYLIGDFLNVSRLQTGKFVIEWKLSNLAEIVQQEINQLQETAKRRDISLTYNKPQNFPQIFIDETKIHQVIMNFIDNAIFYTKPNGKVEVTLMPTPDGYRLEVKDNGIGVPEAERHKLFSKFFRADNAKKARPDGTGIGLYMAKKVVTALGGSLIFESRVGKGSTFGFILPTSLKNSPIIKGLEVNEVA